MKQLPIYVHLCVLTLCIFCVQISIINIFADHKYNENLTHARRQLVPGLVVRLTLIKAKTQPGIEARYLHAPRPRCFYISFSFYIPNPPPTHTHTTGMLCIEDYIAMQELIVPMSEE